jgi:cysteine synthase
MKTTGKHYKNNWTRNLEGYRRNCNALAAMGTTGTIILVLSLKEKNPAIQIVGAQPSDGSQIPGIRKWPQEYYKNI